MTERRRRRRLGRATGAVGVLAAVAALALPPAAAYAENWDGGPGADIAFLDWRDVLRPMHGCEKVRWPDITYTDLTAMFPGKVTPADAVRPGLERLNAQLRIGHIARTPNRVAAFLATLVNESATGAFFHLDLLSYPGKAATGHRPPDSAVDCYRD